MYNTYNYTNLLSMLGTGCSSLSGCGSFGNYSSLGNSNIINSLFAGVEGRSVYSTNNSKSSSSSNWSAGSIIGLAFGLAAVGVGGLWGITALNNHQTKKAAQQAAETKVKGNNTKIDKLDTEIKDLEGALDGNNLKADANLTTLSSYCSKEVTTYKNAKSTVDSTTTDLASKQTAFDNLNTRSAGECNEYKDEIAQLKSDAANPEKTADEQKAANDRIDLLEKEWEEKKRKAENALKDAKTALSSAERAMNDAKKALVDAINDKLADKRAEMQKLQKASEDAMQNEKLHRKCNEEDEFDTIMEKINSGKASHKEIERAFNYKFREYCNTDSSDSKKKELKEDAIAIYKALGADVSDDIKRKYDILISGGKAWGI